MTLEDAIAMAASSLIRQMDSDTMALAIIEGIIISCRTKHTIIAIADMHIIMKLDLDSLQLTLTDDTKDFGFKHFDYILNCSSINQLN